jgi:hypothetical protein
MKAIRFNALAIKDNAQLIAGIFVGKLVLKPTGIRLGREYRDRGLWFSHVAANLAADGEPVSFFPVFIA